MIYLDFSKNNVTLQKITKTMTFMRTRKTYLKPIMAFEVFTPQEYVASCESIEVAKTSCNWDYLRLDINYDNHYGNGGVGDPEFGGNAFYQSPSPLIIGQNCELINMNVYRFIGSQGQAYDSYTDYQDRSLYRHIATQVLKRVYNGKTFYYTYKPGGDYTTADLDYFPPISKKNQS